MAGYISQTICIGLRVSKNVQMRKIVGQGIQYSDGYTKFIKLCWTLSPILHERVLNKGWKEATFHWSPTHVMVVIMLFTLLILILPGAKGTGRWMVTSSVWYLARDWSLLTAGRTYWKLHLVLSCSKEAWMAVLSLQGLHSCPKVWWPTGFGESQVLRVSLSRRAQCAASNSHSNGIIMWVWVEKFHVSET